ncbi:MerR family transcriptional regulator [Streptomyces sp. NPDC097727]|uniref:MerR family transcriptional regulator n=1 Tax=Streptomyces sp. NPDC097727 TaxID=3366092 RepID=UPI0038068284
MSYATMKISELSRRTEVSTRLLRYYEEQGLLSPCRLPNGYRDYPDSSVERVGQIRALLKAGLGTEVIREIVPCFHGSGPDMRPDVHPDLVANLARELAEIEERIDTLIRNRDAIRCYLTEAAGGDEYRLPTSEDTSTKTRAANRGLTRSPVHA